MRCDCNVTVTKLQVENLKGKNVFRVSHLSSRISSLVQIRIIDYERHLVGEKSVGSVSNNALDG